MLLTPFRDCILPAKLGNFMNCVSLLFCTPQCFRSFFATYTWGRSGGVCVLGRQCHYLNAPEKVILSSE